MCGTFFVAFLSSLTSLVHLHSVMSTYHSHNSLMSTTKGKCSCMLTHTHTAVKHGMKHGHTHTPRWSRILVVSQVSSSIRKPIMFCTWAYRPRDFRAIVQICLFLVPKMFHLSKGEHHECCWKTSEISYLYIGINDVYQVDNILSVIQSESVCMTGQEAHSFLSEHKYRHKITYKG